MTELIRFKAALSSDAELRLKYLKTLDGLMTDGEITPEMASVAAKKLGFSISADEFKNENADRELWGNELEYVNGGYSESIEFAPDGRLVGSLCGLYITWTDYWICNEKGLCPMGGFHEIESGRSGRVCRKCRLGLDERGVIECYDKDGKAINYCSN